VHQLVIKEGSDIVKLTECLTDFAKPFSYDGLRKIFLIGNINKETNFGCMFPEGLEMSSPR